MCFLFLPVEFQRSAFSGFAQRNRRPPFGGERKRIANRQVRGAHKRRAPPRRPFSLACYVPDSNSSKALGLWTCFAPCRSVATAPHPGAKRGSESLTRRGFFVPYLSSLTAGDSRRPTGMVRFLHIARRSSGLFFGFASRNRRCSADEEKCLRNARVPVAMTPTGCACILCIALYFEHCVVFFVIP